MAYDEAALHGRWGRSPEDDSGDEIVFRPASYPFPPSRGRRFIELRPDGSYAETSPGPVDVPEESTGRWSLEGGRLVLEAGGDGPAESWKVIAAGSDGLRLRR